MEPDLKQSILDLETAFWNAMQGKDGAAAAKLCGDTVIVTNANGVSSLSVKKMAEMTVEGKWKLNRFSFSDVHVTSPSPDVAIIGYVVQQDVTMDGETKVYSAAECSTWVWKDDGWLCYAHCESALQQVT
ncbi:MAG: nuclear transport factor 2 family protein [Pseudomonadota bacterium]|uniref:nuclear transport factor 2 family protein n=1 Tax=Tabrizicola sp. TaxID=2005166 RepID=UPI0025DECCAE|nr:nuclear transport factor 2 family protein [Tabrizicola sp.]